jgi:hypothetical protein
MESWKLSEVGPRDVNALLEQAYMEEYLAQLGYSLASLKRLPPAQAKELMRAASIFASTHLSEVEQRSHLLEDLHGVTSRH